MKEKVKAITKIASVLLFVFLSGCEKDSYDPNLQETNATIIKKVSLKDLSSKEEPQLFKSIQQLKQKNSPESKMINDSVHGFFFDDQEGKLIQTLDSKSYTFPIYRKKGGDKIENLLFNQNADGSYDTYIVSYDFTEEEFQTLSTSQTLQQTQVTYTPISLHARYTTICVDVWGIVKNTDHGGQLHGADCTCNAGYDWVLSSTQCTTSSNPDGSGNTNTGGWQNGDFNGTNPSTGSGGMNTTPVITPGTRFMYSLPTIVRDFVLEMPVASQEVIFNYLATHNVDGDMTTFDSAIVTKVKNALSGLSPFLFCELPVESQVSIINYMVANDFSSSSVVFANGLIVQASQNPDSFPGIVPSIIEKEIDDSQLPPCARNIVAKLKNLQQNDFATIIAKLGDANTPYTVTITPNLSNFSTSVAETYIIPNAINPNFYNYSIDIKPDYLSTATDLGIAQTIIHELIHAYFYSILADYIHSGGINISLSSFPELWDFYVVKKNLGSDPNPAQHNQIANSFIIIIAQALQEYNTGIPITSTSQVEQLYKDLAWDGLKETSAFELLTSEEQSRISAISSAENENTTQTNVANGQTNNPVGIPCN